MDKILLALAELRTDLKNFFSSASTVSAELVKDIKAQLATANETIAARDTTIKELQAAATTAGTNLTAKDTEITTLKASVEAEKKRANAVLAAQGLPAGTVPAAEATEQPGSEAKSAFATYNELLAKDPHAAGVYYLANAAKVLSSRK